MTDSNSIHDIQEIGFREETTEGTSVITTGTEPIQFGQYTTSWGRFPVLMQDIIPHVKGAQLDPYAIRVTKTSIQGDVSHVPVDGTSWYLALGDASGDGTTHTVTGIQTGDLPSYSIRWDTSNGTDFIRADAVGCRTQRISSIINLKEPDGVLTENISYIGKELNIGATMDGDNVNLPPEFANTAAFEAQNVYRRDSNLTALWDSSGTPIELKEYLFDMGIIMDTQLQPRFVDGQLFPQWIGTGNRVWTVGFKMLRSNETAVFDDYAAQRTALSGKNFTFKIFNSPTTYRLYTLTNIVVNKCELNHASLAAGEEPFYEVEIMSHSGQLEIVDGVNKSFYGDYTI